jgi:methylmalonyl-CoA mutase N-terminal domain/subunit
LWARTLQERYSVSDPDLLSFNILSFTAGSTLTAQQPMNNLVRVAIEVLASALGGCQLIHACSMDEALCTPTEQSVKMSLRTQQIIANETGVDRTVDPLAGSYFVECLTTELEDRAKEYLQLIQEMGGSIRAIESGYFQKELSKSAYELNRQVEHGDRVVVGVNQYSEEEEPFCELQRVDPRLEEKQRRKLNRLREERDNAAVSESLTRVKSAAQNQENVVPSIIDAVKTYATVGEICDALRDVYGEYESHGYF